MRSTAGMEVASLRRSPSQEAIRDRKSTRLNSSHGYISYAVFCLKKKKKKKNKNKTIEKTIINQKPVNNHTHESTYNLLHLTSINLTSNVHIHVQNDM